MRPSPEGCSISPMSSLVNLQGRESVLFVLSASDNAVGIQMPSPSSVLFSCSDTLDCFYFEDLVFMAVVLVAAIPCLCLCRGLLKVNDSFRIREELVRVILTCGSCAGKAKMGTVMRVLCSIVARA